MKTPQNIKKILYAILGLIVILSIIFGVYSYFSAQRKYASYSLNEIISLDDKEKIKALEYRIKDLSGQVDKLRDDASDATKYAIYINLAEARLELGKYDLALESLNKIPDTQRNNDRTGIAFVKAFVGRDNIPQAKEQSERNLASFDEDAVIWLQYLELHQDLEKDLLNAKYREAISKVKSNLEIMISYAKFNERIGDKATAIAAWETAINFDAANEGKYREEIARLRQ